MTEIIEFDTSRILPRRESVLLAQGIASDYDVDDKVKSLLERAYELFTETTEARGIMKDLDVDRFTEIYTGDGLNDTGTPVADIIPGAEYLTLFAITLGERVSSKINDLFAENDFALAAMLDSVCSEAADMGAELLQNRHHERLIQNNKIDNSEVSLRYSPGYCGWHISGQRKLFEYLKPESIGITLRESFLMEPLKSISGVIITGQSSIHKFENDYPCCEKCETESCRERIAKL